MTISEKINLQLFAANDTVHSTEGFVNANAGTVESYNGNGLSPEMKTFYDKTLIELATPNLVHTQFAQKRPIPPHGGKTVEFRRMKPLAKNLNTITEGITPKGAKMTVVPLTATLNQYGDYIEQTDLIEMTAIDNTVIEATKLLADQAGRTIDTIVRDVLQTGTNVNYASINDGSKVTPADSRAMLDENAKLRVVDVFKAAAQLRAMNAPTIDGSYVAVIHPYVAFDLMQDAEGQWVDIQKYAKPENVLNGEIGTLGGVRFVQSSEAKIFYGEDLSADARNLTVSAYTDEASDVNVTAGEATAYRVTVNEAVTTDILGRKVIYKGKNGDVIATVAGVNTGLKYIYLDHGEDIAYTSGDTLCPGEGAGDGSAVFATLFIGANAYGTTDIAGGGIEHIVKQKGYGNDPLNQRSSVGWKAAKVACRLVEEYMLRVESSSSFAASVMEEN